MCYTSPIGKGLCRWAILLISCAYVIGVIKNGRIFNVYRVAV